MHTGKAGVICYALAMDSAARFAAKGWGDVFGKDHDRCRTGGSLFRFDPTEDEGNLKLVSRMGS